MILTYYLYLSTELYLYKNSYNYTNYTCISIFYSNVAYSFFIFNLKKINKTHFRTQRCNLSIDCRLI